MNILELCKNRRTHCQCWCNWLKFGLLYGKEVPPCLDGFLQNRYFLYSHGFSSHLGFHMNTHLPLPVLSPEQFFELSMFNRKMYVHWSQWSHLNLVPASLSAVFRSEKGTKLLHTSRACPGDGSHYYWCIRFLTCALLDYHIKLRDLQL